jgi:hypothetical protein
MGVALRVRTPSASKLKALGGPVDIANNGP